MHSVAHWDALGFEYLVMSTWELLNGISVGCCTVACKLSIRSRDVLECPDTHSSTVFNVWRLYASLIYTWSGTLTFLLSPTILHCISPFYLLIACRFILPLPSIPGAIHGLQFNPHKESTHLLASGGADGEVFVMSLEKPDKPNVRIYSVSFVDCMISRFVTSMRMSPNAIITVCTTCTVQHCFLQ